MQIFIEGKPIDAHAVTYNSGLGYGRFDAPDTHVHGYELRLSREELLTCIGGRTRRR